MTHPYIELPPIPLLQETHDGKSDKYFVKIKLRIYPTTSTLDLYEFKMYLFENGDPEEFLLSVRNFNMTIAALWALEAGAKIQYLCTLVCELALHQFDSLSADV